MLGFCDPNTELVLLVFAGYDRLWNGGMRPRAGLNGVVPIRGEFQPLRRAPPMRASRWGSGSPRPPLSSGLRALGPPPAEHARDRSRTSLPLCTQRVYSRHGANCVKLSELLMYNVCSKSNSIFGSRPRFTTIGVGKLMWDIGLSKVNFSILLA